MTYGWAILIIVIVAVILYSMGIFNPSSSVTFTSSGFSPFTVSSSLCNNIGYKIAVLAGPIPNNANSITINKVFLTSATGANTTTAGYTLTNPVTLKSGQSTTIIIPNVACTAAKVHYSFSAKIQYSYTASTLGLQTVNTTGTIAGTSISGKPSVLTSYEPITITNTQSSATPSPFQQMVNFTSSDNGWTSISTGNFGQNVEFFYYNGTIIPSWLESYTSTNAIWWLKIAAIPAGSSETVYVGFAPVSTNLFNTVNDGEALTSVDDGYSVFPFYQDFLYNQSLSAWDYSYSGSNTYKFTSYGLEFIGSGGVWQQLLLKKQFSNLYIENAYQYNWSSTSGSYGQGIFEGSTSVNPSGYDISLASGGEVSRVGTNGNGVSATYGHPISIPGYIGEFYYNQTIIIGYNGKQLLSGLWQQSVSNLGVDLNSLSFGFNMPNSDGGIQATYENYLVRSLPPNNVMPSVSFGSVA